MEDGVPFIAGNADGNGDLVVAGDEEILDVTDELEEQLEWQPAAKKSKGPKEPKELDERDRLPESIQDITILAHHRFVFSKQMPPPREKEGGIGPFDMLSEIVPTGGGANIVVAKLRSLQLRELASRWEPPRD
jgi:hypothetical protein